MTRSILDSYSIDWKDHSIDRKEFSIDRKIKEIHHEVFGWLDRFSLPVWSIERNSWSVETYETEFFQIFLVIVFDFWLEQNIVHWSHQNEIEIKTKFHWYYSLKVLYGKVKIKLKQHYNINISFIK